MHEPVFVLTAAGRGTRLREVGGPAKAAIDLNGRPLLYWSLVGVAKSIRDQFRLVVVCQKRDHLRPIIIETARTLGIPSVDIVELSADTEGQAESLTLGLGEVDWDSPIVAWNCDTWIRPGVVNEIPPANWLLCFRASSPNLSYALVADDGETILKLAEKQVISEFATSGLYSFESRRVFEQAYSAYRRRAMESNSPGEKYIAPIYNEIIGAGGLVRAQVVASEDIRPLGTREEIAAASQAAGPLG